MCGCTGGGVRNSGRRPVISPKRVGILGSSSIPRGPSPSELRALSAKAAVSAQAISNDAGLTQKRRDIERRRREAIARRLGK